MNEALARTERSFLGAALLSPRVLAEYAEQVETRHLCDPQVRVVYEAMLQLHASGSPIDVVTITNQLAKTGKLAAAGGEFEVDALAAAVPVVANIRAYADEILREWSWRERQAAAQRLAAASQLKDEDAWEAATETVFHQDAPTDRMLSAVEVADLAFSELEEGPEVPGVTLPWPLLGRPLPSGKLLMGETTVLSAYSSMGKSVCSVQLADHAARDEGANVGFYPNEMTVQRVTWRMVAGISGVPFKRLIERPSKLAPDEQKRVMEAFGQVRVQMPDGGAHGKTAKELARSLRRHRFDVAVIDHFHRIPGTSRPGDAKDAVNYLCDAAMSAGTHLLLACQLRKAGGDGKSRARPLPSADDMAETVALYQTPANVLFLHRWEEEVTVPDRKEKRVERAADGIMWFDKIRDGAPDLSTVNVFLDDRRMQFIEKDLA